MFPSLELAKEEFGGVIEQRPEIKKIVEAFNGAPINVLFVNPSKENKPKRRRRKKRGKRNRLIRD